MTLDDVSSSCAVQTGSFNGTEIGWGLTLAIRVTWALAPVRRIARLGYYVAVSIAFGGIANDARIQRHRRRRPHPRAPRPVGQVHRSRIPRAPAAVRHRRQRQGAPER